MSRTLGLVELSVSLYRLLLAAYPPAFRNEYGEAMTQLFRDTAFDGYRRRGLFGLLAVWPRTFVDFAVSVVRQHREKTVEAGNESVLLRDLARQWGQFGSAALTATTLSIWYIFHLLHLFSRRSVRVWATLTMAAVVIWVWSLFSSNGTRFYGGETNFHLWKGSVEIWHVYERGEPLPSEQWHKDRLQVKYDPSFLRRLTSKPTVWEFSFLSGVSAAKVVQTDAQGHTALVQPGNSWRFRFPFLILPALLLCGTILAYRRGHTVSGPAMQSA